MFKACVVLHNYVRERDGYKVEDAMTLTGLEDVPGQIAVRGELTADIIRNKVADYFITNARSVPWKMSKI